MQGGACDFLQLGLFYFFATEEKEGHREKREKKKRVKSKGKSKKVNHELTRMDTNLKTKKDRS